MVKVAINGFGRIGRQILRIGLNDSELDFLAVNDLTDVETLAHLFKYDSVHGKFSGSVNIDGDYLVVNGKKIKVFNEKEPENLPWDSLGIDIVVESTGFFRTKELASKHLKAGAKKVLISAPAKGKGPVKTIVMGVNEHTYNKEEDHIISNASCTTNSLAPVVKVLNDNFGIEHGFMTTIHSYTSTQNLLDGPHKDLRRARAAAENIVPTTTGAASAVEEVVPEVKGCLDGMAMRVPTPDGSITDFVCLLKKETTVEEVNNLFKSVSQNHLKKIIEYTEEELVSKDIVGNPHSSIFDSKSTRMIGKKFLKVLAWYDNEWGFSSRMVDLLKILV